jgi:hypothetical protein
VRPSLGSIHLNDKAWGRSVVSVIKRIKIKGKGEKIVKKKRETPKIKEFMCTVSNSGRLANWVSISLSVRIGCQILKFLSKQSVGWEASEV